MKALVDWIRLLMGLVAGGTVGAVLGLGYDLTPSAACTMGATVAILAGLVSTTLLRAWFPRREKPSSTGSWALLVLLCSYLVVARMVWVQLGAAELGAYLAAGLVLAWLVFTAAAEPALFTAFVLGGLAGAVGGVVGPLLFQGAFLPLFSEVSGVGNTSLVYASLGLLGAFSGAFASVGGRLSGWGLRGRQEDVWKFDEEGRLETPSEDA